MLKKFNNFISLSIIYSIVFAIIGLILITFPDITIQVISYIISIGLIINGIYMIMKYNEKVFFVDYLTLGVLSAILGIIILLYPNLLSTIIPIIVGIFVIINSVFKIRISLILQETEDSNWVLTMLLAILTMICGILMIFNPQVGALTLTTMLGILLLIYSVSAFIDLIIFKNNVNNIVRYLK